MQKIIGLIRHNVVASDDEQVELIRKLAGSEICVRDLTWQSYAQIIRLLKRLKRDGYSAVVVQDIQHLSRNWPFLKRMLQAIRDTGLMLYSVSDTADCLELVKLDEISESLLENREFITIDSTDVLWLTGVASGGVITNHDMEDYLATTFEWLQTADEPSLNVVIGRLRRAIILAQLVNKIEQEPETISPR